MSRIFPSRPYLIAIPFGAEVRLTVAGQTLESLGDIDVRPVPRWEIADRDRLRQRVDGDRPDDEPFARIPRYERKPGRQGRAPRPHVWLGETSIARDQRLLQLHVAPARPSADGNLSWLRSATVNLEFVGGELASRQRVTAFDDFYAEQVVNFEQGRASVAHPPSRPRAARASLAAVARSPRESSCAARVCSG